ncbi:unnamed protein product [Zymoseptoria tritici ST99CH_3D1]|uniref:Uncharacterized protein n=1 Tax=Zymoseptoria tritici ST99CH_1E4 TaxID=1276532 RepID=A0A2H1H0S0_ZYMTR|nr:unnamed protein product [Zymoseptoria tritici ST99CH_1E4]SMR63241.1 unnamed protein product [Zymoseptoria tritici ST99CH_3D1]
MASAWYAVVSGNIFEAWAVEPELITQQEGDTLNDLDAKYGGRFRGAFGHVAGFTVWLVVREEMRFASEVLNFESADEPEGPGVNHDVDQATETFGNHRYAPVQKSGPSSGIEK